MPALGNQVLRYLPATVVPAAVSFASVYTFTRVLPAAEYGLFNIALSAAMIAQASFFYGLQLGILRLFPAAEHAGAAQRFLKTVYVACFCIVALVSAAYFPVAHFLPLSTQARSVATLAVVLFLLRSMVSINQSVNRAAGRIGRVNLVECCHSLLGYALALLLAVAVAATASSVLLGMLAGAGVAACIDLASMRTATLRVQFDLQLISQLIRFGGPLALSYFVMNLLQNSDRLIIGTINGTAAAGIYAVAINLVEKPITLICAAITTATFPAAVRSLEREGNPAAGLQVSRSGAILILLVFPACVGIALAARPLAAVMVGPEFRDGVAHLIPIVSAAALLRGVAVHFLEHAFHLSRRTDHLLAIYVPVTILNILLNYMLLPRFGVISAAWVAVFSQLVIVVADYHVGRRNFSFTFPFGEVLKCAVATGGMALALRFAAVSESSAGLATMVVIGITTYAVLALALDFAGLRQFLFRKY